MGPRGIETNESQYVFLSYHLAQFLPAFICIEGARLCTHTKLYLALENLNAFTGSPGRIAFRKVISRRKAVFLVGRRPSSLEPTACFWEIG